VTGGKPIHESMKYLACCHGNRLFHRHDRLQQQEPRPWVRRQKSSVVFWLRSFVSVVSPCVLLAAAEGTPATVGIGILCWTAGSLEATENARAPDRRDGQETPRQSVVRGRQTVGGPVRQSLRQRLLRPRREEIPGAGTVLSSWMKWPAERLGTNDRTAVIGPVIARWEAAAMPSRETG